jgi:hypothetical protein
VDGYIAAIPSAGIFAAIDGTPRRIYPRFSISTSMWMLILGVFSIHPASAQKRDMGMGFITLRCSFVAHPFRNSPE